MFVNYSELWTCFSCFFYNNVHVYFILFLEEKENLALYMLPTIFPNRSKAKTGGRSNVQDAMPSFIDTKLVSVRKGLKKYLLCILIKSFLTMPLAIWSPVWGGRGKWGGGQVFAQELTFCARGLGVLPSFSQKEKWIPFCCWSYNQPIGIQKILGHVLASLSVAFGCFDELSRQSFIQDGKQKWLALWWYSHM